MAYVVPSCGSFRPTMEAVRAVRAIRGLTGLVISGALSVGCGSSDDSNNDQKTPDDGDSIDESVPKEEIGNEIFDETQVKSCYLTFSEEEYDKLMDFSTLLLDP